ncbi:MAG: hypothetical protein BWY83_03028 [bacterium ADurb.Bin478]|nr:MAG: hypothetical protein BWY83_03028 [bacterium ADurb.Bin478]
MRHDQSHDRGAVIHSLRLIDQSAHLTPQFLRLVRIKLSGDNRLPYALMAKLCAQR